MKISSLRVIAAAACVCLTFAISPSAEEDTRPPWERLIEPAEPDLEAIERAANPPPPETKASESAHAGDEKPAKKVREPKKPREKKPREPKPPKEPRKPKEPRQARASKKAAEKPAPAVEQPTPAVTEEPAVPATAQEQPKPAKPAKAQEQPKPADPVKAEDPAKTEEQPRAEDPAKAEEPPMPAEPVKAEESPRPKEPAKAQAKPAAPAKPQEQPAPAEDAAIAQESAGPAAETSADAKPAKPKKEKPPKAPREPKPPKEPKTASEDSGLRPFQPRLGLRAGMGIGGLGGHQDSLPVMNGDAVSYDTARTLAPSVSAGIGLVYTTEINEQLGVTCEIQYTFYYSSSEDVRKTPRDKKFRSLHVAEVQLHSLELPVLIRVNAGDLNGMPFYAEAGPQLGINLYGRLENNNQVWLPKLSGFAFGPTAGCGIDAGVVDIGVRGHIGLLDYVKKAGGRPWAVMLNATSYFK